MDLINREIEHRVKESLSAPHQAVILYGPRQAGKTTLINLISGQLDQGQVIRFIGDDLAAQQQLGRHELATLSQLVSGKTLVIIDEAQRIPNIGLTIKLLVDNFPLTVLASGSASFDLADKLNEPLTGRTKTFTLFPFSYGELVESYRQVLPKTALEEMLRFGMYPKVYSFNSEAEKSDYLFEYINNYLYRDLLIMSGIKKPDKVVDLLRLLALQIGREVAVSELAQNLAISALTVSRYLDVLEKMFVVVKLRGFSRNLRKEIAKTAKYYFFDIGLRNALLRSFNPLSLRDDAGALFENWVIMERMKLANNHRQPNNFYFWRTYDQQEIDLIEEGSSKLTAYECKWRSAEKAAGASATWRSAYPGADFKVINSENFQSFLA